MAFIPGRSSLRRLVAAAVVCVITQPYTAGTVIILSIRVECSHYLKIHRYIYPYTHFERRCKHVLVHQRRA